MVRKEEVSLLWATALVALSNAFRKARDGWPGQRAHVPAEAPVVIALWSLTYGKRRKDTIHSETLT